MSVPKAKNISKNALFVWNNTNNEYEAWDGVLNTGDIEIGAVELKDGDTDTRADIELDSAKNSLFVQSETLATEASLSKLIGFEIPAYDYIDLSYTGVDLTGVVYKTGGSGGTTVATLVLTYTTNVLQTVTKT